MKELNIKSNYIVSHEKLIAFFGLTSNSYKIVCKPNKTINGYSHSENFTFNKSHYFDRETQSKIAKHVNKNVVILWTYEKDDDKEAHMLFTESVFKKLLKQDIKTLLTEKHTIKLVDQELHLKNVSYEAFLEDQELVEEVKAEMKLKAISKKVKDF